MSKRCRRRNLLRVGGAAALTSLAGCATIQADLGLRTEQLGRVTLANSMDEYVEVDVKVHRDDSLIHESTHELTPGSAKERVQMVLHEWRENDEARSWEIKARTNESQWRSAEIDAAVGDRNDCHDVTIVTGDWPETPLLVLLGDCTTNEAGVPTDR